MQTHDDGGRNLRSLNLAFQQHTHGHLSDSLGLGRLVPVDFAEANVVL